MTRTTCHWGTCFPSPTTITFSSFLPTSYDPPRNQHCKVRRLMLRIHPEELSS